MFVHYIAKNRRSILRHQLESAKFLSIISDGSMDSSVTEAEILFVQFCMVLMLNKQFWQGELVQSSKYSTGLVKVAQD